MIAAGVLTLNPRRNAVHYSDVAEHQSVRKRAEPKQSDSHTLIGRCTAWLSGTAYAVKETRVTAELRLSPSSNQSLGCWDVSVVARQRREPSGSGEASDGYSSQPFFTVRRVDQGSEYGMRCLRREQESKSCKLHSSRVPISACAAESEPRTGAGVVERE